MMRSLAVLVPSIVAAALFGASCSTPSLPIAPDMGAGTSGTPASGGQRGQYGGLLLPAGPGTVEEIAQADDADRQIRLWLVPYDASRAPYPPGTLLAGVVQLVGATASSPVTMQSYMPDGKTPMLFASLAADPSGTYTLAATATIGSGTYPLNFSYP